jgi:hypothetical protein
VAFEQRFDSGLRVNLHWHVVWADGVFASAPQSGRAEFCAHPEVTDAAVAQAAHPLEHLVQGTVAAASDRRRPARWGKVRTVSVPAEETTQTPAWQRRSRGSWRGEAGRRRSGNGFQTVRLSAEELAAAEVVKLRYFTGLTAPCARRTGTGPTPRPGSTGG